MIVMPLMNLVIGFKLRNVKKKGNMEPKGRCEGYLRPNRWNEGNFVPFPIVRGYFRTFSK